MIEFFEKNEVDYVLTKYLLIGIAPYNIRMTTMKDIIEEKAATDIEIWGGYLNWSERFRIFEYKISNSLFKNPEGRLTLDSSEDCDLFKKVFNELYKSEEIFSFNEVVQLLEDNEDYQVK
jgi:spore coat polysaccharide biosynthesis protein SpsF (cytidylyltransferase family)